FEAVDAEGVTALLRGFGQAIVGAEDELFLRFQRVGAKTHHDAVEIAGARIKVASGAVEIEQMKVVHDDGRMRLQRVTDEVIERLLQRERMVFGRSFHEILHLQERTADLLVQLPEDGGFAATDATPKPDNRSGLKASREGIKGPSLGGG